MGVVCCGMQIMNLFKLNMMILFLRKYLNDLGFDFFDDLVDDFFVRVILWD
jgi:hypothetical protein